MQTLLERMLKLYKVDPAKFNVWLDAAIKRKDPILDQYDRANHARMVIEADSETWAIRNIDKPGFKTGQLKWQDRIAEAKARCETALTRILKVVKQV